MNDGDFGDWQICWQANLLFHKRAQKSQQCISCSEVKECSEDTRRSTFWIEATRCSAGHRQATQGETSATPSLAVCGTCDRNYVFDSVRGKHECRRQACRRLVRVNEVEVKRRLQHDQQLLAQFLDLVKRRMVYDCAICGEEVGYGSRPAIAFQGPTPNCHHDRNVCNTCLTMIFEAAIRGGRWDDLKCPDAECQNPIPLDAIRSNVSTEVFKTYNKHLALKTISKDDRFRWCACGHGQIHGGGESNPEWECLGCEKRHCYICRDNLSDTCEHLQAIDAKKIRTKQQQKEAARRAFAGSANRRQEVQFQKRENVKATKDLMARTTKMCPAAGCGTRIERNAGCGHFTCRKCRIDFCWACKVIFKNNSGLHLIGCRIGTQSTIAKDRLDTTGYAKGWDKDKGYDTDLDADLWLPDNYM